MLQWTLRHIYHFELWFSLGICPGVGFLKAVLLNNRGEGNGNPLQCSCLENPVDGGAWWAAVHRVAQSLTWLKRLSIACIVKQREPVMYALKILKRYFVYLKGSRRYHLTFFSGLNQRHHRTAMNLIFTLKLLLYLRVSCHPVKLQIRNSFIFQPRES